MHQPTIYNTSFANEFSATVARHKHRRKLTLYMLDAARIDPEVRITDGDAYEKDRHVTLTFFNFSDLSRVCIETAFGHFSAWQA